MGLASSLLKNTLLAQDKRGCHNSYIVLCIEATSHAYDTDTGRRRRHAGFGSSSTAASSSGFLADSASSSDGYDMSEDEYYDILDALDSEV